MTKIVAGSIPANDVVFELTLEPVRGLDMVKSDGYGTSGWKFKGEELIELQTWRFKLVSVGYCSDLDEVREKLASPGQEPALGQAREAFKKAFPQNDGKGPIGFPDPSWVNPIGRVSFPVLVRSGEGWRSRFGWADFSREGHWRWLVEVK